jgi:flagellar basal-body rod modification protein FlgD
MATVQDAISATRSTTTSSGLTTSKAADIQDRFLTLLVTQLKNQDPLSPMDNSQITTQLSQISTVSGIDKLNSTMNGLAQAMALSQTMNSVSMIGRQVVTSSSTLTLANKSATGAIELLDEADRASVTITGPAGNIVRRIDLGAMTAGLKQFSWDGKTDAGAAAADGTYSYKIEAMKNGKAVNATTYSVGTVSSVGISGSDATFLLNGGKEVKFTDVKRIQ